MKNFIKYNFVRCLFCCLVMQTSTAGAQNFDRLWEEVERVEDEGLPRIVVQLTDSIYREAVKTKNIPQMMKSYIWRMKYRKSISNDNFYTDIRALEDWNMYAVDSVEKAVLHSVLAGMYAKYVCLNVRALEARKSVSSKPLSEDICTWGTTGFVDRVKRHVVGSLRQPSLLLGVSSESYIPFTESWEKGDTYKHDMYHLIGFHNIESLNSIYNELDSRDGKLMRPSIINLIDSIYSDMTMNYLRKDNKAAALFVKLDHLQWKYRGQSYQHIKMVEEDPYLRELNSLIDTYKALDVCTEVYLAKAKHIVKRNLPNALEVCEEAIRKYPLYTRISELQDLKKIILAPWFGSSIDKLVYPDSRASVKIRHKNLDGFKVVLTQNGDWVSEQYFSLKRSPNHQERDTTFSFKTPSEGIYQVRVIPDPVGDEIEEKTIYVTRLTVLAGNLPQNQCKIISLDRQTGHPVQGVDVILYDRDKKVLRETKTDHRGISIIETGDYRYVSAQKDRSDFPCSHIYMWEYQGRERQKEQMRLFTDRNTYRPGQTVYVKGVTCTLDSDTSNVLPGKEYILTLIDANKQEIGKKSVRTNNFGSFAAEFVLPVSCLNGTFRLMADGKQVHSIRVEEYKRPTFHLVFDRQRTAYQLGDTIQVTGQVMLFSGIPLGNLSVDYVTSYFSDYTSRWDDEPVPDRQLASGKIKLDSNGKFSIPLILVCDTSKKDRHDHYRIEVSVKAENEEMRTFKNYLSADTASFSLYTNDIWRRECKDAMFPVLFRARNSAQVDLKISGSYALFPATEDGKIIPGSQSVCVGTFVTEKNIEMDWRALPSGNYVLTAKAVDDKGRVVEMEKKFLLFSAEDTRPVINSTQWLYVQNSHFDETHPAVFYYGTSLKDVCVMMDVCNGSSLTESRVFGLSDSIARIEVPYREEYKEGASVKIYFLKGNKVYSEQISLYRHRTSDKLSVKWKMFRDKLRPGQVEKWTLALKTPEGKPADAEMLVTMYDASLYKMSKAYYSVSYLLPNYAVQFHSVDPSTNYFGYGGKGKHVSPSDFGGGDRFDSILEYWDFYDMRPRSPRQSDSFVSVARSSVVLAEPTMIENPGALLQGRGGGMATELRTNFSETAFFYPQLRTDKRGEVSFSFTIPHELTRWHLRGYAHTRGMQTGTVDTLVTTYKEFVLTPNCPRFIRMGDRSSMTASIANMSAKTQSGSVSLTFFDPVTDKEISTYKQHFNVGANKTVGVSFLFDTPEEYPVVGWKMIADGADFSDGEQHLLPVLSDKETVLESLPLTVRDRKVHTFSLDSLFNRHDGEATHRRLTVEFTENPVWYTIQALSYLKQCETEDAVAWATAYYANALASHIMDTHPQIQTVVNAYRSQGKSDSWEQSRLKMNRELKNISLNNSPWMQEAQTDEERKVSQLTLFDSNHIHNSCMEAASRLKKLQNTDGSWSWYHGMCGNRYMTTYIAMLLSRLNMLTGNSLDTDSIVSEMQRAAFSYFHEQALEEYKDLSKKRLLHKLPLSGWQLQYLYLVVISGAEVPVASRPAYDYFLSNVESIITHSSMTNKALAAIVLHKAGNKKAADKFLASLQEYMTSDSVNGTFFAFNADPSYWHTMKVPAHVVAMEAFHTIRPDSLQLMGEMKSWLIRQKQVRQWGNPIATADAVYAILMYGENPVKQQAGLKIKMDGRALQLPGSRKGGMKGVGYLKESFIQDEVVNARKISVEKKEKGIAWGTVYALYELPVGKVKKQTVSGLNLNRTLYVERMINGKKKWERITEETPLVIGDKVTSELTFSLDRPMNFIQLRDGRGACFEPMDTRPGRQRVGRLTYYMDVKDDASHFFFDYLDKGVYIIRHSYQVSRTGTYTTGTACIQNAYAPDFVSQTGSEKVHILL